MDEFLNEQGIPSQALHVVLADTGLQLKAGDPTISIEGITSDSRAVKPGFLFVATIGLTVDGHSYIDKAIALGATAVLAKAGHTQQREGVAWIEAADTNAVLGKVAASYFEHPSQELELIGITGTNGKTTVATLCFDLFTKLGYRCGLIGTVEVRIGDRIEPATHTTPDAVAVQQRLREMADEGCGYVFMEVSSHALVQGRTNGCHFAGGVFTNISHDHLDYHGDMKSYISAKKLLFDGLPKTAFALVNFDDKRGRVMLQNCKASHRSYALRTLTDYKGRILDDTLRGLHLMVNDTEVHTRLAGSFNAYNFLAAYGVAVELEQDASDALLALSALRGAAGRLEVIDAPTQKLIGVVDYAHTPDALQNVLETLQPIRRQGHQLFTVFGCGGDRDRSKRPLMGEIAAKLSDHVIITDDNPRTEDAASIRAAIELGISQDGRERVLQIPDRRQAIRTAVRMARDEDVILVAGKGHETYQEIDGVRTDFDDRAVLREYLSPS
ncbi:MAG: UDP-N-acetylmuramoyl-L-alanyl-D-glutamate--2,6-diaminopimelate ligase [Saprospiraceae bacterium]